MEDELNLLEDFLDSLNNPIIVEGKNDKAALEKLGVQEHIIELNKGIPLFRIVEALQDYDMIIILTDMDQEGKIIRKKLIHLFNDYGIREDVKPRELFARLRLSHVEGLDTYANGIGYSTE